MQRPISWALALVLASCSGGTPSPDGPSPQVSSRNALAGSDLRATGASSVYDALKQLRPTWLTPQRSLSREGALAGGASSSGRNEADPRQATSGSAGASSGVALAVVLDGIRVGGVTYLQGLSVEGVQVIRLIEGTEAARRWGPQAGAGVIEVVRGGS